LVAARRPGVPATTMSLPMARGTPERNAHNNNQPWPTTTATLLRQQHVSYWHFADDDSENNNSIKSMC
jgi:hypothetical protein